MANIDTKENIRQTVMELMKTRPIDKIKVTEIISVLEISRSTFYLYFDSVYDVVQEAENEMLTELEGIVDIAFAYPFMDRYFNEPHPGIMAGIRFTKKYYDMISILAGEYGDPTVVYKCKKMLREIFYEKAVRENYISPPEKQKELAGIFMTGGHWELVTYYIRNGFDWSDEELAVLGYRLMFGAWRSKLF